MCWWVLMVLLALLGSSDETRAVNWLSGLLTRSKGDKDMITQRKLFAILLSCAMQLASAALVFGQEKRGTIESRGERPGPETQLPGDNIGFIGSEMGFSFDGKVVKG